MLKSVKNTILDIIRQADLLLLALCTVTSLFGVVMIYSATRYQGGLKCVIIQLCGLALGIVLYFVVSMVDLTEISKKWQWLLAFNLGFFLLLKTPLGVSANGNLAWLGVRGIPIQVQPAEVVKLTFILLLARQLVWMKGRGDMKSIPAVGLLAGNLLVTIGLYYVISSDMGSALVYVCIFACMAFAAGVASGGSLWASLGAGAGFYLLWELDKIPPYMKERFQVLVDHSLYPLEAGWQADPEPAGHRRRSPDGTRAAPRGSDPEYLLREPALPAHGLHLRRHRGGVGDAGLCADAGAAGGHRYPLYRSGPQRQEPAGRIHLRGRSGDAGVPDRLQRGDVPVCAAGGGPDAALHQLWRLVGGDAVHRHGHGLRHPEALPAGLAALAA